MFLEVSSMWPPRTDLRWSCAGWSALSHQQHDSREGFLQGQRCSQSVGTQAPTVCLGTSGKPLYVSRYITCATYPNTYAYGIHLGGQDRLIHGYIMKVFCSCAFIVGLNLLRERLVCSLSCLESRGLSGVEEWRDREYCTVQVRDLPQRLGQKPGPRPPGPGELARSCLACGACVAGGRLLGEARPRGQREPA